MSAHRKLIECREMLFAASQNLWTIVGVLRDREMKETASAVSDLASMLGDFSTSIDIPEQPGSEQ